MRDVPRPAPTGDLDTPEDIAEMVRRFYADVAQDDLLGPIFNEVARVDWSEHLPKLTAFWCRALLGLPDYSGNPFRAHAAVHAERPFTLAHFERWLSLFRETLELGWVGPIAHRAAALAENVARVHSRQLVGVAGSPDATHAVDPPHPAPPGEASPSLERDVQTRARERCGTIHAPTHLDLLATARAARSAASCGDAARLYAALARLRTDLEHHCEAESEQLALAPDATATVAVDGQRRLLALLNDVLFARGEDGAGCTCLARAVEVEIALARQARLEEHMLRRHARAWPDSA